MDKFLQVVTDVNGAINNVVWGVPMLALLIGTGLLISILTGFFQFRKFGYVWSHTIGGIFKKKELRESKDKKAISQFQSLCTALSATIGTGNITGVAVAIMMGGPGAVFWMWIAAILGMMTHYAEVVLGIYYRRRNKDGEWSGGAMYYLKDGLGSAKIGKYVGPVLAVLFSFFAIFASFGIGNMMQFRSITESISAVTQSADQQTVSIVVGIIVIVLAGLVILGGIKRIATTNEKLVPFMAIFYIIGSVIILVMNAAQIGPAFASIFKGAFNFNAAAGGTIGGAYIIQSMIWGFKRGVFSNEAGLGSSATAHSASNVKEPVEQGLWGIFEVFTDTIIVCTCTALVVLTSGVIDLSASIPDKANGLALASHAFTNSFGAFGGIFISIAIFLFAFSTILGWSYYGVKAWEYIFGTKSTVVYKIIFLAMIIVGVVMDASLVIDISDTFNALMAIPNLIGVICLSGLVIKITKNYTRRRIRKSAPDEKPMYSYDEAIQKEIEARED